MREVKSQLEYCRRRLAALVDLCRKDKETETNVSEEARNIAQDIITRLNRLPDQIMFAYFTAKVQPQLTPEEFKKRERTVQFPVCSKPEDMRSQLGQCGFADLETLDPATFAIIDEVQPYRTKDSWLHHLRKYSNLGHRKLLAQSRRQDATVTLGGAIKIRADIASGVTMRNVTVNGMHIEHLSVGGGSVSGRMDPGINPQVEIKVMYLLEGENIDVLNLCQASISGIEKIAEKFEKIISTPAA